MGSKECKDEYHLTLRAVHEFSFRLLCSEWDGSCDDDHPGQISLLRSSNVKCGSARLEVHMARRSFLRQLLALPFAGAVSGFAQNSSRKPLNIMMKSAWGSDDPTKAAFPFLHGLALSEAGHSVQIFLLGEAVSLMRKSVAAAVVPVGWPPLEQTLTKVAERHVQIYACGACSRARSVAQSDLDQWGAKYGNPTIFVSLVEWADRVITE
jgi:predicted peroxiredoxin